MVYRGKPSKGCQTCREKRIRCGLQPLPPGCSNCLKRGLQCPGYRNQLDLMFEDESQNVIRKINNKDHITASKTSVGSTGKKSEPSQGRKDLPRCHVPNTKPDPSATSDRAKPSEDPSAALSRPLIQSLRRRASPDISNSRESLFAVDRLELQAEFAANPQRTLTPSLEDRGLAFFVCFFVMPDGPAVRDEIGTTLISSMKAVGLAGLSTYACASEMRQESRKLYLEAIQRTNAALRSSTEVKENSTLLSIIILGAYEVLDESSSQSLAAWESHINGAAALLRLRGPQALRTPTGVRLFLHATSNIFALCMKHKIPLPDIIEPLTEEASKYVIRSNPGWQYFQLSRRIVEYYAQIRRGLITDVHQILASALEFDRLVVAIFSDIPPRWHYSVVPAAADPDVVFSGYYHIYDNFIAANLWNGVRVFRMLLHEIVRRTITHDRCSTPPYSTPQQFQLSTEILLHLQADILASVPQNIGYVSYQEKSGTSKVSSYLENYEHSFDGPSFPWSDFRYNHVAHEVFDMTQWDDLLPRHELPLTRTFGGASLPWALYTAGMVDVATDDVRRWCSRILRFMGSKMGIRQAAVLADEVDKEIGHHGILPF